MARTVNPKEFAAKREEILNAARRLVFTKGFDQMSIQDILNELQISSGAFHHYFGSREALLDAFIEGIRQESEKPLLPIIQDPHRTAIQKLQGFFDALDSLRMVYKAEVAKMSRIWYTDANAIVRQKVGQAIFEQRAPLIASIVRQGIQEGIFNNPYPDKTGEVILSLLQGMGDTHARLLLTYDLEKGETPEALACRIENIITTHAAYMDAIERILGAQPNSLYRADPATVKAWITTMQDGKES